MFMCDSFKVLSRWEEFLSIIKVNKPGATRDVTAIQSNFPFAKFFENAPQPLFKAESFEKDFEIAQGCFRHIKKIFTQLEVK